MINEFGAKCIKERLEKIAEAAENEDGQHRDDIEQEWDAECFRKRLEVLTAFELKCSRRRCRLRVQHDVTHDE